MTEYERMQNDESIRVYKDGAPSPTKGGAGLENLGNGYGQIRDKYI